MLSANKTKFLRALQHKKYRQKYHKFTVEGVKLCNEVLMEKLVPVAEIYASRDWLREHSAIVPPDAETVELEPAAFKKISHFKTPQEVLLVCRIMEKHPDLQYTQEGWCLYLDGIRDPGNLGTILRIADWFGVQAVYLSRDCVDHYNPKVIHASMASLFRVPVMVLPYESIQLPNHNTVIWAADGNGANIFNVPVPSNGMLVIGNEGTGVSRDMLSRSDNIVAIPSTYSKGAESLNAAVATAVLLTRINFLKY